MDPHLPCGSERNCVKKERLSAWDGAAGHGVTRVERTFTKWAGWASSRHALLFLTLDIPSCRAGYLVPAQGVGTGFRRKLGRNLGWQLHTSSTMESSRVSTLH
jgi:hypothetical protein